MFIKSIVAQRESEGHFEARRLYSMLKSLNQTKTKDDGKTAKAFYTCSVNLFNKGNEGATESEVREPSRTTINLMHFLSPLQPETIVQHTGKCIKTVIW